MTNEMESHKEKAVYYILDPLWAMRSEMPTSCAGAASGTLPDRFTLLRWLRNLL